VSKSQDLENGHHIRTFGGAIFEKTHTSRVIRFKYLHTYLPNKRNENKEEGFYFIDFCAYGGARVMGWDWSWIGWDGKGTGWDWGLHGRWRNVGWDELVKLIYSG
jgi:hypothetical protein